LTEVRANVAVTDQDLLMGMEVNRVARYSWSLRLTNVSIEESGAW